MVAGKLSSVSEKQGLVVYIDDQTSLIFELLLYLDNNTAIHLFMQKKYNGFTLFLRMFSSGIPAVRRSTSLTKRVTWPMLNEIWDSAITKTTSQATNSTSGNSGELLAGNTNISPITEWKHRLENEETDGITRTDLHTCMAGDYVNLWLNKWWKVIHRKKIKETENYTTERTNTLTDMGQNDHAVKKDQNIVELFPPSAIITVLAK